MGVGAVGQAEGVGEEKASLFCVNCGIHDLQIDMPGRIVACLE